MLQSRTSWNSIGLEPVTEKPETLWFLNTGAASATVTVFFWKPFGAWEFVYMEMVRSIFNVLFHTLSDCSKAVLNVAMHLDYIELTIRCHGVDVKEELEVLLRVIRRVFSPGALIKCVPQLRANLVEQYVVTLKLDGRSSARSSFQITPTVSGRPMLSV